MNRSSAFWRFVCAATLLLNLTGASSLLNGADYFVSPTGDDSAAGTAQAPWQTLAKACASVEPGDTVYLRGGVWNERLIPQTKGTSSGEIAFRAYEDETPVIDGTGMAVPAGEGLVELTDMSWLRIDGLTIRNSVNFGIHAYNLRNATIENCTITNTVNSGISLTRNGTVRVEYNTLESVCFYPEDYAFSHGDVESGIAVWDSTFTYLIGNTVFNSGSGSVGGEGIGVRKHCTFVFVQENHVYNIAQKPGIFIDAYDERTANILVYQNRVHDCAGNGILLASEAGGELASPSVFNNVVYDNALAGIMISDTGDGESAHPVSAPKILHNTCYQNAGGGILVKNADADDVVIINNICVDNSEFQIAVEANGEGIISNNNIQFPVLEHEFALVADSDIEANPLFNDSANRDFRLLEGSPAIDAATTGSFAPEDDFDGDTRDGSPDIGAYEYKNISNYADPLALGEVRYWAYQIQDLQEEGRVEALANSQYDMVVIDPTRTDWSDDSSRDFDIITTIDTLKQSFASDGEHRKLVLAYVNIGQAENWRYYWTWNQPWISGIPKPDSWPDFIIAEDPDGWEGNYPVAYWDEAWQNIILDGVGISGAPYGAYTSVLDEVLSSGFDGVYLDWVQAYEFDFTQTAAQAAGVDPAEEMLLFIEKIRNYGQAVNPDFLVVQQNAAELIEEEPSLATVIDAIAHESVFFNGIATDNWQDSRNADSFTEGDDTTYYLEKLQIYKDAGLPVFNCEYAKDYAGTAYFESYNNGLLPYVSRTPLSRLTTTPPFSWDINPPEHRVSTEADLAFIHHSSGEIWLEFGLLPELLGKSYIDEYNDIDYGSDLEPDAGRPDSLADVPGDSTDINHWIYWFNDYLESLKSHNSDDGANQIIMFKSCFPNSDIPEETYGPGDPFSCCSVNTCKAVFTHPDGYAASYTSSDGTSYKPLDQVFGQNPETLFIYVTAPPNVDQNTSPENAARARDLNNWLKTDWLKAYNAQYPGQHNVAVYDWFEFLAFSASHVQANMLKSGYRNSDDDSHINWRAAEESAADFASIDHNFLDAVWTAFDTGTTPDFNISTVDRSINKALVNLTVNPVDGVSTYTVTERLEAHITPFDINQGGVWNESSHTITWGPYNDDLVRQFKYEVDANGYIGGSGLFDNKTVSATGDSRVTEVPVVMTTTPGRFDFEPAGGNGTINVASNTSWSTLASEPWITILSGSSGQGDGTVSFTVGSIDSINARSGTIDFGLQSVQVFQSGRSPTLTLNPTNAQFSGNGGTGSFNIMVTPSDAPWIASSDAGWVVITQGQSGTGSGTVLYSVSQNTTTNTRTARINIGDLAFTIKQQGELPVYGISPMSKNFSPTGGTGIINVSVSPESATWSATKTAIWVTITAGASGTGPGQVTYRISENQNMEARQTTIEIAGIEFLIYQEGKGSQSIWDQLTWFGGISDDQSPLLWTNELGWVYSNSGTADDVMFFAYDISSLGWFWTNEGVYPWLWSFTLNGWYFYYAGTGDGTGGWFHDLNQGQNVWLSQ